MLCSSCTAAPAAAARSCARARDAPCSTQSPLPRHPRAGQQTCPRAASPDQPCGTRARGRQAGSRASFRRQPPRRLGLQETRHRVSSRPQGERSASPHQQTREMHSHAIGRISLNATSAGDAARQTAKSSRASDPRRNHAGCDLGKRRWNAEGEIRQRRRPLQPLSCPFFEESRRALKLSARIQILRRFWGREKRGSGR